MFRGVNGNLGWFGVKTLHGDPAMVGSVGKLHASESGTLWVDSKAYTSLFITHRLVVGIRYR